LSHAEKKKLKIHFPFKNFKNANLQTDIKTLGQLVVKLRTWEQDLLSRLELKANRNCIVFCMHAFPIGI